MRIGWLAPLALLLATTSAQAQLAPNPTTYFAGPSGRAPLPVQRSIDNKLYLTVMVEGQPLNLFIDTGATSVLDLGVAERLGLALTPTEDHAIGITGVGGKRQLAFVDLKLGKVDITNHEISVVDLSALRELYARNGMPVFDGLIGSELLAVLRARIDFDHLVLEVQRPDRKTLERTGFVNR